MAIVLIGSNLLGASPSASDAKGNAAPAPSVTSAQVPDAGPFVAAAVKFVQAWSQLPQGKTRAQWQAALVPLTTDDLAKALSTTDPAALPGSAPEGEPVVRYLAQTSALVAVPLANGSSVLVTVVNDADGRRVSDVQPFAGDS
jgi:hypothetical protein